MSHRRSSGLWMIPVLCVSAVALLAALAGCSRSNQQELEPTAAAKPSAVKKTAAAKKSGAVKPAELQDLPPMLLPSPQSLELKSGAFQLEPGMRIFLPADLERPEYNAARALQTDAALHAEIPLQLDRAGKTPPEGPAIKLSISQMKDAKPEGYSLTISAEGIDLVGDDAPGLFYGLQTLRQLVRTHGAKLPSLEIRDWPTYPNRGFYHDISRGKVPTVETIKELIDLLASLKINQFQLYIEHPFAWRFDPTISAGLTPLTPDEILELDVYCQDRRIDFVPSFQSFGHMGHILSLPQYRHLAEIETDKSWDEFTWYERMKGLTIDSRNPEAMELLDKLYDGFLPLFSSHQINVCSDETYDLGKGKNAELAEEVGAGRLYLDHIKNLHKMCAAYGKRMMFWGDIVLQHPELVGDIPKDAILLNWGYSANSKFDQTCGVFAEAGLDFYVCPGTSGWNRFVNGFDNADLNIRRFAEAGLKHGAIGLLNTDWGDDGHVNALGSSLHGLCVGAEMGWNTEGAMPAEEFDRVWSALFFDDPSAQGIKELRDISWIGDYLGVWRGFYRSDFLDGEHYKQTRVVTDERLEELIEQCAEAAAIFQRYATEGKGDPLVVAELEFACRMRMLIVEKLLIARAIRRSSGQPMEITEEAAQEAPPAIENPVVDDATKLRLRVFAQELRRNSDEFEALWLARNKKSNVTDVLKVFDEVATQAEKLAGE